MTAAVAPEAGAAGSEPGRAEGRVGPNAVIQLAEALEAQLGADRLVEVFAAAGQRPLLDDPPREMVDQRVVATLFRALQDRLPAETARAVASEAGARTAQYLLANRIPRPVQGLLRWLPPPLSARLLLRAIAANAWTFAGSGRFAYRAGPTHRLEIAYNPIAIPGCAWHVAVFEGLFRALVSPRSGVRQVECCLDGAPACRFEVDPSATG